MNQVPEDICPGCGANLKRGLYSAVIGVEISGVYDGVLFWQCPACNHRWHRFPEGHHLRARAATYIETP